MLRASARSLAAAAGGVLLASFVGPSRPTRSEALKSINTGEDTRDTVASSTKTRLERPKYASAFQEAMHAMREKENEVRILVGVG